MNVEGRVGDEDFPRDAAAQVFRTQQDGIGLEMSAHWMKASILREFVQSKWVHLLRFQRMIEKSWQIKTHGTRTRVPPQAVWKVPFGDRSNIAPQNRSIVLYLCSRSRPLFLILRRPDSVRKVREVGLIAPAVRTTLPAKVLSGNSVNFSSAPSPKTISTPYPRVIQE